MRVQRLQSNGERRIVVTKKVAFMYTLVWVDLPAPEEAAAALADAELDGPLLALATGVEDDETRDGANTVDTVDD